MNSIEALRNPTANQFVHQVLIHSRFLSGAIAQYPNWIEDLAQGSSMYRSFGVGDFHALLVIELNGQAPTALILARFRRRQILRIMLRDVLGFGTLGEVTSELSSLADAIMEAAWTDILHSLSAWHGAPATGFAVIALGKLGGEELNYSSDIDLMFVYGGNGETTGRDPISYKEFFKKAANALTAMLSTFTQEGLCYRVDLRLRPEGSLGEICISLEGARQYYANRSRDWELQMMIKARVVAGDRATGATLLNFVESLTYSTTLDFSAIEVMSATRERLNEKLASKRAGRPGLDIKLAAGGIRDIEFLVQCLQRLHGGRHPWLRRGGSLLALSRLQDKGLISPAEYAGLSNAYQFLRILEHRLQLVDDRQTHVVPANPEELENLAARMSQMLGLERGAASLLEQLASHFSRVREIYDRIVHAERPHQEATRPSDQPAHLRRFLELSAPNLASCLGGSKLRKGHPAFEQFLEELPASRLRDLDHNPELAGCVIDLFECSPYFAGQLTRIPSLVDELTNAATSPEPPPKDPVALRRYFSRHMMRIQSDSICHRRPIFETLEATSELAEMVIRQAYDMATSQVAAEHPPKNPNYVPRDQLMVIALGRLGMREFDLASDADLNFILPESDRVEVIFWTRVAERLIDLLSSYTGEGAMFAVDTRLRPAGREGALVQTDAAYMAYFESRADVWEGIAYMKARAIAGNIERATSFLGNLQETDWKRWGQSGRGREALSEMRLRVEKEQGAANPLKAAAGGYHDIDFILMFLRLKGGGIFFRVLNTPERLSVLEELGHLESGDAALLSAAATFYRALDHGLRLYSGHAEGKLPNSDAKLQALTELVRRWTPQPLEDIPLERQLKLIQEQTRRLFVRYFPAIKTG